MELFDTVAAISTPRGKGGVAMIRISGEDALEIAGKMFLPKSGRSLTEYRSASAIYGDILSGRAEGEIIDDGIATVFRAPHSFTGENTVEICCHGGNLITQRVLEAVLLSGAKAAGPGEFTKRAFVNGRLDMSHVEAIGGLIEAETDAQIKLFSQGAASAMSRTVSDIRDKLTSMLSEIYAKIDYPEEDLSGIPRDEFPGRIYEILSTVERLEKTHKTGYAVANGIRCVICGRANAGKSTLYNALLGYEAAIVTDIEGTTRDVLEHTVPLGTLTLRLFDTAGLRTDATDKVELIGIERTKNAIDSAELILAVFDSSSPMNGEDIALVDRLKGGDTPCIAVLTKSDISTDRFDEAFIRGAFDHVVSVDAKTGRIDELRALAEKLFIDDSINIGNDAVIVSSRQAAAIEGALENLRMAYSASEDGFFEDVCAMYVEGALSAISEMDGREISKDIVDGIFSKFCVGK